jgi:hypothetical protein
MDKRGKPPKKPSTRKSELTPPQAGWPAQAPNEGIKRASAAHDHKPTGRGSARGR